MPEPKPKQIALDADVAQWVRMILFPPPDSGRTGVALNPAADDLVEQAAWLAKVKEQLAG